MGFSVSKFITTILCCLVMASVSFSATITRDLTSGWNLVSVPVADSSNSVADVLGQNLADKITKIWTYDGGWKSWSGADTVASDSTFVSFSPNQGYWFLLSETGTLSVDSPSNARALTLVEQGWTLASFNQGVSLQLGVDVISSDTIDENHEPDNIAKIWGYDGSWKSYSSSANSNDLSEIEPGYGYWFLVQESNGKVVSGDSPMTITPEGADGEPAVLIVGGATTLFPPDANQAGQILGRAPVLSKYSTAKFSSVWSASSTTSTSDNMSCNDASDAGKQIGVAEMWSVDGQLLATDPIVCNSDPRNMPLTFEIGLTKDEAQVIQDKPSLAKDAIINVRLESGQNQKTCLPENPADNLVGVDLNASTTGPIRAADANTSSTSTLAAALVAQEIGKRLGFPPNKFKLGEANGGLEEQNSEVNSIVSSTAADGVDILANMQTIMAGANNSNSPLYVAKQKIDSVNEASALTEAGRASYRGDEISNIMAGASSADTSDTSFSAQLEQVRNIGSGVNELLVKKRNAARKGVITTSEAGNLDEFVEKMTQATVGQNNVLDAASVLVNSLGMANATSGDAALGNLVQSKTKGLIAAAHAAKDALDTTTGTTQAMDLAASAVEFPEDMVSLMAKNKDAAKKLAGVLGMGAKLLDRAESEDNSAQSTDERKLDKLGNLTSKLSNSQGLLTVLAQNAESSDDVSEIFGAAVGAVADTAGAAEDIIAKIGEAKTIVETNSDNRVDFSDMMAKSKKGVKSPAKLAKILAKNAPDASTAQKILAEAASAVTTEELSEVLQDDTLAKEFALGSKIFADAGPLKKIRYSTANTPIKLDARNSFDPSGSNLLYRWYQVDDNGNTSALNTTASASYALIETTVATSGGEIENNYRVVVSNASGKTAQADTVVILVDEVPPVILAPRYLVAKVNTPIVIDASGSFDPDGNRELEFEWSFPGSTNPDQTGPFVSVGYTDPGKYTGTLTLHTLNSTGQRVASATQPIGVKVNGAQPPIADAGYDLVLSVAEAQDLFNELGGLPMDNYSFSLETGDDSGLEYQWEPASYFSRASGVNATSSNPLFTVTKAGTYNVTLTVTDTNDNNDQSASDDITIVIRRGKPPYADAGGVQVVRLGAETETVLLDGSYSFSFVTAQPAYQWSGPTSFSGSTATSAVAEITLDPNNFTKKQRLTYTLEVADANGTAEDTATVVVIPSLATPIPVVEAFPRLPFYRSGDIVELDGSFSFHPDDLALSYNWKILGNAEVVEGDESSSSIALQLPNVAADTKVKVQLVVTDTRNNSATQEVVFNVRADKRPPKAIVNPQFVVLQASSTPRPIAIDGLDSFSKSDNELSYSWRVDTQKVSIVDSDTSSSVIYVHAKADVEDGLTELVLTVTDEGNGLTDTASVFAKLRKRKDQNKPIFLEGEIEQNFDFTTRRFKPVLTPGEFFPSGNTYAYDFPAVYVYEKGDTVSLNGFGYDPNSTPGSFEVSASIYQWDPVNEVYGSVVDQDFGTAQADGFGFVDFSFASSALTTLSTWYALEVRAGSGDKLKVVTMPFQVRPEQVAKQPIAKAIIETIDSPSVGITPVGTTSFSGTFPDDGVFVVVSGKESVNPNGGGLKFQWDASFVQTAAEKKANPAPQLFLLGKDREELMFFWPLSTQALELKITLKVYDEFSNTPSRNAEVILKANQATRVPPVAEPGHYPPIVVPNGQLATLELAGYGSYSPVGNRLGFEWTYLGFQDSEVFAGSNNTSVVVTATLEPGKHPFNLTVTDLTNPDLSDSRFFTVEVEEKRQEDGGINYGIEAFVDAFPIDAEVSQNVEIHSQAYVFPTRPDVNFDSIDFERVKERYTIFKKSNGAVHTPLTTAVAGTGADAVFNEEGEFVVNYEAWYDADGDDAHTPADNSDLFRRKFVIKVRERIEPILANVLFDKPKFRSSGPATVPVTLQVDLNGNSATGWTFGYRYELFNAERPDQAVSYVIDGVNVSGAQTISGTDATEIELDLAQLPFGEYFLELEVKATKGDARLRAQADNFFRVVNSDVQVIVNLIDPDNELNLSNLSLQVFAVANDSTSLDGSMILSVAATSMTSSVDEEGVQHSFSLPNPYDFSNALAGAEKTSGTTEIRGLLVRMYDNNPRNADQAVRLQEYLEDVPSDGEWYIDLIKRDENVEIDGTFMSAGDLFSFRRDEVFVEFEDQDGNDRDDIDILAEEVMVIERGGTDFKTRPVFVTGDDRRVVPVATFGQDSSGDEIGPEDFFDRALSSGGNITFDNEILENSLTGTIFPEAGQLYLFEFFREDGTNNYALMLITYTDDYGFAFRYAKATRSIPDISFGGGVVKDQIRLSMDFDTGTFFAEGGVPGTDYYLISSSNKGYVVTGAPSSDVNTSCEVTATLTTPYEINETCVGTFDNDGQLSGHVEFLEEFQPSEGDMIEIIGYAYEDPSGADRNIDLPNPLRYFFREDKFGGFGLAYTEVVTGGEFHVTYFGEPDIASATNAANYMIKTSDAFDGHLFKMMTAGGHDTVNIVSITQHSMNNSELSGYLKFVLDSDYLSAGTYLAVSASSSVTGMNGEEVERPRHVVTEHAPYGSLVNAPHVDTKWLEVREDDYGWRSEAYLKKATDEASVRYEEFNPHGNFEDFREFVAWDYSNGLQLKGIGAYDSYYGGRQFWEIPQSENGYNSFTNSAPETAVYLALSSSKVGDTLTGEYRMGNSFEAGMFTDFGDNRPKVTYHSTVLRVLPGLSRDNMNFSTSVEIRVVQEIRWPQYDANGPTGDFDEENFEERVYRFWLTDELGIVRNDQEQRYISKDQGSGIDHGYRAKTKVVGYKKAGEDPFVSEGDYNLLLDEGDVFTGFDNVDMHVELGIGEPGANYKLVVLRPSTGLEGHLEDTSISAALDTPENYYNRLPDRYASVHFMAEPTNAGHFIFKVYKYRDGDSVASDVPESAAVVADVPFFIDGTVKHTHLFIELREEDENPSIMLFEGSGFSFLGGEFTPFEEPKRDFAYVRQDFGNAVEMRLNRFLPDGQSDSNRRIKEVFLEGNDMREKFERIMSGESSVNTQGLTSAQRNIVLQPGKTYLYTGPGVDSVKGVGQDRVLVLLGIVSKDDNSMSFVYLMKAISDIQSFESFKNIPINNRFDLEVQENFYEESVRIQNFVDLMSTKTTHDIDFNLVGGPMEVMSAIDSGNATPDIQLTVMDGAYALNVLTSSDIGIAATGIVRLDRRVDLYGLGSALPQKVLTNSAPVTATSTYDRPYSFLVTDEHGNHILMNVDSFIHFGDMTGGVQLGTQYFVEYIYLMDGSTPEYRYYAHPDGNVEKDDRPMQTHDVLLDFNLTGKEFVEISDANQALIEIEGDRNYGNYHIYPSDHNQQDILRGARVFAVMDFDVSEGTTIRLDRFDGEGHVDLYEDEAREGAELGELDFGGFLNGNIQFSFSDDPQRHRGDKVTITKLMWQLPGSSSMLERTASIVFEFNPDNTGDVFPQPAGGEGFQAFGARTGMDGDEPYVDVLFSKDLDNESREYDYLVRLEMRNEDHHYYPENGAHDDMNGMETDPIHDDMHHTGIVDPVWRPTDLVIMDNPKVLRAYFPISAGEQILATDSLMELIIDADFSGSLPKGIVSTEGELLNHGYVRLGNKKLFMGDEDGSMPNFMPFDEANQYVYEQFGDMNFSTDMHSTVTATLRGTDNTFALTDVVNAKLVRHFENANGEFSFCGSGLLADDECKTLWKMDSTLGSAIPLNGGGYAVIRDVIPYFYAGGLEYQNVLIIEAIVPRGDELLKHNIAFVDGVGMVQHFTDFIDRNNFDYKGFKGMELVGYKVGDKQRGRLEGVAGVSFEGLNLEFKFNVPESYTGPFNLQLYQRTMNGEKELCYSNATSNTVTANFENASGDEIKMIFLPVGSANSPCGIIPENGRYNLIANLTDVTGQMAISNVDLFANMTDFYWFMDFGINQGPAAGGPRVFDGERFSFLRHQHDFNNEGWWDVEFSFPETGEPTVSVENTSGNRLIRKVSGEGKFSEAKGLPGHTITTNGLANQITENNLVNQNLEVEEGGLYLIKIPQADRRNAINNQGVTGDAYVLMFIKQIDYGELSMEFSYLVRTDDLQADTDGVINFNFQPDNGIDPEFNTGGGGNTGGNFGEKAPSRQGYLHLQPNDCADLELDTFDFATFERNENLPIDSCNQGNGSTDVRLDRFELVEDAEANARARSGEWFGKLMMHVNVPGGYEKLPFKYWEVDQLPHALHESALPKTDSKTGITAEIPFRMEFDHGYCHGGAWFEGGYVANESGTESNEANKFIFQVQTWIEYGDHQSGSNVSQPSSLDDCTSTMNPKLSLQYKYFAHERNLPDLESIAVAGDFNGTGNVHPASGLGRDEVLEYGIGVSAGSDDKLAMWADAMRSVDSVMLSTYQENYCDYHNDGSMQDDGMDAMGDMTNTQDPNMMDDSMHSDDMHCKGPVRFRVGTNDMVFENWGVSAYIEASGYQEGYPLRYRMEAMSARSYRDQQFTTSEGEFKLGQLQLGYQHDMNMMTTEEDHHSDAPNLWIDFGPEVYGQPPFEKMEVHELTFTLPLSRLSVDVTVSQTIEFESNEYGEADVSVDFDPQTQSAAFTMSETAGMWLVLSPDGDDGTLTFNGDGTATSTYMDMDQPVGEQQQEETTSFEMVDGHIYAPDTEEGPAEVFKTNIPVQIPNVQFSDDVILVMLPDEDNQGKYEPEVWFRSQNDKDEFVANNGFESLAMMFEGDHSGTGDHTGGGEHPVDVISFEVSGDETDFIFSGQTLASDYRSSGDYFQLYSGMTYEFKVITQGITLAVPLQEGVSLKETTESTNTWMVEATMGQTLVWAVPYDFNGNLDFFDPDQNSSRNGTFTVTSPPDGMGDGDGDGAGGHTLPDGMESQMAYVESFPMMGDSNTFYTLGGPDLTDCDGTLFMSASSLDLQAEDPVKCPNAPMYMHMLKTEDFDGRSITYFDLSDMNDMDSSAKLFKTSMVAEHSQMGTLESTVVFYVTTDANDLEQFRPEIWFKDSNDRDSFIADGGWDRLFPGGFSGDGTGHSTSCMPTSSDVIAICVSVDSDDRTTDTTDYGYVFTSSALSLNNVASPGKQRDGVMYPEAFELYRGMTYEFHVDAPGAPFTLVNFQTRISLGASDGVTDNTTDDGIITFSIPSNTSLTGIVYRHQDPINPDHSARGEEGHILIVDYDGNDDDGHFGPGDGQPAPIVFDLTANASSDYIFSSDVLDHNLSDPGSNQTTPIVLYRGGTYEFHNKTGGHPFALAFDRTDSNTHLTENDGVQGNGAAGPSGVVTFTIPMDAQYDTVDYYCTAHPGTMFGTFNIQDYPGDSSDHGGNSTDSMFTGVSAFFDQDDNLTVEFDNLPTDVDTVNVIVSSTQGFDPASMNSDVEVLGGGQNQGDLVPETLSNTQSFVSGVLTILTPQTGQTLYFRLGAKDSNGQHLGMLSDEYEVTF